MATKNKYEAYLTNRMTESANSSLMSMNNVNRFLKDLYSSDLSIPSKAQFRNAELTAVEIYRQASNGQDSSDISEMKFAIDSFVANTLGVNVRSVATNRSVYWKNMFGLEDTKTIWTAISDSFTSWSETDKLSKLANSYLNTTDPELRADLIEDMREANLSLGRLSDPNKPYRNMPANAVIGAAAQIPDTFISTAIALGTSAALLGLATLAGVYAAPVSAGVAAASAAGAISVPKVALALGTVASKANIFKSTYDKTRGLMIYDLLNMTDEDGNSIDIDDQKVKDDINLDALIEGGLEVFSDVGFDMMVNKGLLTPVKGIIGDAGAKAAKGMIKYVKKTGSFAGATLLDTLSESATEGLEGATGAYFKNRILKYANSKGSNFSVIDDFGFDNAVSEFTSSFLEAVPTSLVLGSVASAQGSAINFVSYEYDKRKISKTNELYGMDFEASSLKNEFATSKNNAFSEEKYKVVDRNSFNVTVDKMSDESKAKFNEMLIIKETKDADGNPVSQNMGERLSAQLKGNKRAETAPEGFRSATIRDRETKTDIEVFVPEKLTPASIVVDNGLTPIGFNNDESEATIAIQRLLDTASGVSAVPVQIVNVDESRHASFDHTTDKTANIKSFADEKTLQKYVNHSINSRNRTIEFPTKSQANKFIRSVRDSNAAILGNNYYLSSGKTQLVFRIGDNDVAYTVKVLDNKNSNANQSATLNQASFVSIPDDIQEDNDYKNLVARGSTREEAYGYVDGIRKIKQDILSKLEASRNEGRATQNIKSTTKLNNIAEAGARALFAIQQRTGISTDEFMDMIDFRFAGRAEMDGLNGSIEILGKVLNQQIEDAESFVADNSDKPFITTTSKQSSKAQTKDYVFKTEDGSEYRFTEKAREEGEAPAVVKDHGDNVTLEELDAIINSMRDLKRDGKISKVISIDTQRDLRSAISGKGLKYEKLVNDIQKDLDGTIGTERLAKDKSDAYMILHSTGLIDAYTPNKKTMVVLNPNQYSVEKMEAKESVSVDQNGKATATQLEAKTGRAYKYTITLTKNANASTIVHEAGHMMRDMLTDEELAEVSKIYGVDIHRWLDSNGEIKRTDDGKYVFGLNTYDKKKDAEAARQHAIGIEERFANDFLRFVDSGKADSPILQRVFSKIRQLLRGVAKYISTSAPGVNQDLSDDVIALFNKLLKPAEGLDTSKATEKIVTDEGKKLSAVDVDAFIGKGYYIPLDELKRSLNDDGDRKITAAGHTMKLSEYLYYRNLLNKSDDSRGTPFDIYVYEGMDSAKEYLTRMVGDDATGAILLDIVKEISSTSLKPSQYVSAIQNKLINDTKYMIAEAQAIAESFGPYRLSKSGKIEIRQYEPADNSAVRNARAIREALISGDKSMLAIAVSDAKQDIVDNPQIWAREVFRAESLYDINYAEGQKWYYESMLDDKNRYFNYLMTFNDDSMFAFTNESVDSKLNMDVDDADLQFDEADKIDKEIGMFGDRIGKIFMGLDAKNVTDEARNNAIVGMEKEFAERARKDAISMAESIAEDKFRDTLAYVNDNINLIARLLEESGITTDELGELREYVNELAGSTRALSTDQVKESINKIKEKFDSLHLDSVDEVFNMTLDDIDSLDAMLAETSDLIDESINDYAESERLINNLLHAIDTNSYIKQNQKLQNNLKNALNNLANANHKINVQANRISRLKTVISARNQSIQQLKAAIKALNNNQTAMKARLRQALSSTYKKKIVHRTSNPSGADISYSSLFTYINYLVGNKVYVSDSFTESLGQMDPTEYDLILTQKQKTPNKEGARYEDESAIGQNDVFSTPRESEAGMMVAEYRYIMENGIPKSGGRIVLDDGTVVESVMSAGKHRFTGNMLNEVVRAMPAEVKNAIKKATALVNPTANYTDVIEKIISRQFGAWGVENQKIVYKAVGFLIDDARAVRSRKVQERNLNASNLAMKMAQGLNKDFKISTDDRNTLLIQIIDPDGSMNITTTSGRYRILDAYFDFNNHTGLYQSIMNKYGNADPFDIIADQDDVKVKLASKLLYDDQFKIMDFTVKDDFVSPFQKFMDSMMIETSQPSLIFNYLSERSGDRYDSEFDGSFNDFFIRQALDNDVAEKKAVNARFARTAEEFRNDFGMDYKKRAKVFDTADVLGPDGKFHTTDELGLLSINRKTAVRNDKNGGNVKHDSGKYTRSEMLTIYMHTRHIYDEKGTMQRIGNGFFKDYRTKYTHQFICLTDAKFGHRIDSAELENMHFHPEQYLTDNEIKFADFMMKEIKSPFYQLKMLTENLANRLMVSEKNYFPMEAENASDKNIDSRRNFFAVNVNNKMTKERTNSIYRINLDSIDVFEKNLRKQEHFIHWAEWADTFNRIWDKQGNLEEVVLKTMGDQMKNYVYDYASLMADRNYFSPKRKDLILNKLIGNASMARVAGSPLTIIRQTGSYLSGMLQLHTTKEMFNAVGMLHKNVAGTNMTWAEFIDELDPDIMDRMLSPMMEDSLSAYRKESGNAFIAAGQEATAQLMKGIQWMDKFVAKQIWMAAYIKESKGKIPDKVSASGAMYNSEAAYKAMMAVRKTQSGSSVVENTMLQNKAKYGSSIWAKLAVLFANDIIKLQSDMYWGSIREGRHKNLLGVFTRAGAVPLIMMMFNCFLNFDWLPEEDDDGEIDWEALVKDMKQEWPTEFIPIAGKAVTANLRGWGGDDYMPLASEFSKLITTLDRVIDPPRGSTRLGSAVSGIKDMAIGAAAYAGLPSELARKGLNVIFDTKNLDIRLNPLFLLNTNLGNWGEAILPWRQ